MIDLEKLKAKAELAATASHTWKWRYEKMGQTVWGHGIGGGQMLESSFMVADIRGWGHLQYLPNGAELQNATGEFVAAANPSVVLDLIKEIETLRQTLEFVSAEYHESTKEEHEAFVKKRNQCVGCNGSGEEILVFMGRPTIFRPCPYCEGTGNL